MKLTLEPTNDQRDKLPDAKHLTITVQHPDDDLAVDDLADMVRGILLAAGYSPGCVDELIEPR